MNLPEKYSISFCLTTPNPPSSHVHMRSVSISLRHRVRWEPGLCWARQELPQGLSASTGAVLHALSFPNHFRPTAGVSVGQAHPWPTLACHSATSFLFGLATGSLLYLENPGGLSLLQDSPNIFAICGCLDYTKHLCYLSRAVRILNTKLFLDLRHTFML